MTLPAELVTAIARAVEEQGGDANDAQDLTATWERLHADRGGRVDRLRYDAAHPRCNCADGGDWDHGERCARCHGLPDREDAERGTTRDVSEAETARAATGQGEDWQNGGEPSQPSAPRLRLLDGGSRHGAEPR